MRTLKPKTTRLRVDLERLRRRKRLLEGLARGERALEDGRVLTDAQARRRMSRWLK